MLVLSHIVVIGLYAYALILFMPNSFLLVRLTIQRPLPLLFKFAERYILSYKVPANSKFATVLVANNRCKLGRGKLVEELVLIQRNRITRLRRLIYKCYCQTSTVDTYICNIVVGKIFKIALSRGVYSRQKGFAELAINSILYYIRPHLFVLCPRMVKVYAVQEFGESLALLSLTSSASGGAII